MVNASVLVKMMKTLNITFCIIANIVEENLISFLLLLN